MKFDLRTKIFASAVTALFIWGALLTHPALAEFVKFDKNKLYALPTTSEDVILDFIKLSGVQSPEFEKMIVRGEKYKMTPENEKVGFLQDEMLRLNKKYITLNPSGTGILVRLAIKAHFENIPDKQSTLTMEFPSKGLIYFPYYYGGLPVAVLINGIEDFQKIYLTEDERQEVAARVNPTPDATLILDLKPVGVGKKPMNLDGEDQFPLLCEISYIGIHNRDSDQIWGWKSTEDKDTDNAPPSLEGIGPSKSDMGDKPPLQ